MRQLTTYLSCIGLLLLTLLSPAAFANPLLANQAAEESEPSATETESQKQPEIDLVAAMGLDKVSNDVEKQLNSLLSDYGLNSSLAGQLVSTLGIVLLAIIAFIIGRRIAAKVFLTLNSNSDRIYLDRGRLRLYQKIISWFIALVLASLASIALAAIWSSDEESWPMGEYFATLFVPLFNFTLVVIFSIVLFELITSLAESYFRKVSHHSSPRINTLLPIVRNLIYGAMMVMLGLTILSQLGIDIVPLLAGAGVIGFAVAFGAQTLIKDVITGFIIIVEDLIQVGDVATLAGKTGFIEKITIRKVQMRDLCGTVYTVPFSEIGVVENLTKEFSYYLMDVGIAYRENPDEVIALMREICEEMRQEEPYKTDILEPIEIFGVDQFADSAIVIKARIKTRPIRQWDTGREYNRRMKHVFDAHNIEIPFPHQTIYFGEDKDGSAPAARIMMNREKNQQKAFDELQPNDKQPRVETDDANLPDGDGSD